MKIMFIDVSWYNFKFTVVSWLKKSMFTDVIWYEIKFTV